MQINASSASFKFESLHMLVYLLILLQGEQDLCYFSYLSFLCKHSITTSLDIGPKIFDSSVSFSPWNKTCVHMAHRVSLRSLGNTGV